MPKPVVPAKMAARSARPVRAPAPPLPLLADLDETHRQILQTLDQLRDLMLHIEVHGPDHAARARADAICRFFDSSARAHHQAEEDRVFPKLLASGTPELIQNVLRLQQDHGWLEQDWLELGSELRALAAGHVAYDHDLLRAAVPVFGELYREHIALEEDVVYPASRSRAN
jgi:hemerythrin-like domain-containing protein